MSWAEHELVISGCRDQRSIYCVRLVSRRSSLTCCGGGGTAVVGLASVAIKLGIEDRWLLCPRRREVWGSSAAGAGKGGYRSGMYCRRPAAAARSAEDSPRRQHSQAWRWGPRRARRWRKDNVVLVCGRGGAKLQEKRRAETSCLSCLLALMRAGGQEFVCATVSPVACHAHERTHVGTWPHLQMKMPELCLGPQAS